MRLLQAIVSKFSPCLPIKQSTLKHSRLGYLEAKGRRERVDLDRKTHEISSIKSKLPPQLVAKLQPNLRYSNWRLVYERVSAGLAPPKYCLQYDPLTVIPKDDRVCVKALSVPKRKTGGRNNTGSICTRRIGGGFKRRIRLLDRHKKQENPQKVIRIEHDPNRSAKLMLLQDTTSQRLSYRLAVDGIQPGQIIQDTLNNNISIAPNPTHQDPDVKVKPKSVDPGACLPLKMIPLGSKIHDIETLPHGGGKLVKSAGTFATLVGHIPGKGKSQIRLPSNQTKTVSSECRASIGAVGNQKWHLRVLGKAGRSRNLGIRPHVRGVAMNAVDHPHGGGKGGRGKGKPSQSPWGKVCK